MPPANNQRPKVRPAPGGPITTLVQAAQKATAPPKPAAPKTVVRPKPGTPFGKFQANEPLAPIYRARTKASATVAKSYGYSGPVHVLAHIGTQINPSPKVKAKPKGGSLLATIVPPIGIAKALTHGDIAGAIAAANPAAPALKLIHPAEKIATNSAKDLVNLPANAIPSTYLIGKTAVEGHVGKAAKMLAAPYVHFFHHPVSDFEKHPLNSYLLFAGVKGGIGRGAGRMMRAAPKGSVVERAASTERAPATVPGTSLEQIRRYSPDVTVKARQVVGEKRAVAKSQKLSQQAQAAQAAGQEDKAIRLGEKAAAKDPTLMKPTEQRKRMSEAVDANEIIRRQNRARVSRQVKQAVPKNSSAAVNLVAQGITKASKQDLLAYRDELAAEHPNLEGAKARANRVLRQQITKAVNGKMDETAIQQAASKYGEIVRPLQAKIAQAGLYDAGQMERRALLPYAVRHMGATHDGEKIVGPDGAALSNDAIRAHMHANGVKEPAYVTQAPSTRGARNFYVAQHEAPQASRAVYTGKATKQGTFDAHPDTLAEGAARMQGLVDAQEGFRRLVGEFGRKENGQLVTKQTYQDAKQHVADLNTQPGVKWRAIRINPFLGKSEQLHTLVDQVNADHPANHEHVNEAVLEATAKNAKPGPGPWAFVPEHAADQLQKHVRALGPAVGGKALQKASSLFRTTVLATSPRWLTGNVVEAGLRSVIGRAGPRSYYTGVRVQRALDRMDPAAGQEHAARVAQGGHFSMADRMPQRGTQQFQNTRLEPLANALGTFWRAPGPKQVAAVWHGWTQFVFHDTNNKIERQFQTAMAGAHVRRNLMTGHMLKLSDQAIHEAAQGLRDTNAQVELGRAVDRMYGQYSKFGPERKAFVAMYTPFIAWSLNAVQFIGSVLPRDHPVLTSLIASASLASEQWRKQHGLDVFMKGALPPFLQGTIPLKGGAKLPASRYTPFGFFDDVTGNAAGSVLPQFSGVLSALKGEDWKGKKLTVNGQPANDLQKLVAAAQSFAESTIPVYGQSAQVAGGKTPAQLVNPFTPYKAKAKKSKAGGLIDYGGGQSGGSIDWGSGGSGSQINWGG